MSFSLSFVVHRPTVATNYIISIFFWLILYGYTWESGWIAVSLKKGEFIYQGNYYDSKRRNPCLVLSVEFSA
jgi:hypothetical protein